MTKNIAQTVNSEKGSLFYFSIVLFILMGLDIVSTEIAISQGHNEQNPIMKFVVGSTIIFILLKLIVSIVIIFLISKAIKMDKNKAIVGMRLIIGFMVFVVIGNILVDIGLAESGILRVQSNVGNSWTTTTSSDSGITFNPLTGYFVFDTANYNHITQFKETFIGGMTYPLQADSTTFSCVSGAICTGTVAYDAIAGTMTWSFVNATITASPFNVTYSKNLGVTSSENYVGCGPGSTSPIWHSTVGGTCERKKSNSGTTSYFSQTSKDFSNTYNVTYSNPNLFTVSINKNASTVASKITISNYTFASPFIFQESTYNTVGFNFTGTYQNGLSIKMNDSSNNYDLALVNSSGCSGCPIPIVTQTPVINPNTGTGISWVQTSYSLNDIGTVNYVVDTTIWQNIASLFGFDTYYVEIGQNGNYNTFFNINSNGNYSISLNTHGIWVTNIRRYSSLFDTHSSSNSIVSTSSTTVNADSPSYTLFVSPQFMRVPFNITYHIGHSMSGYGPTNININIIDKNNGNIADSLFGINTTDGTLQAQGTKSYAQGAYDVTLYDARKNLVLDSKSLQIIQNASTIPILGITTNNISADKTYYFIGDIATISFLVNDSIFQNYSVRGEIYNYNLSTVTKYFYTPFSSQLGSFDTLVNAKNDMKCDKGLYCWFESGLNNVRLTAYNSTTSFVIANQNITVASTTIDGWGLSLSSNNISTTDTLIIKVIVPDTHFGTMWIRDAGMDINATKIYSNPVTPGIYTYRTQITRVNSNRFGYYEVELIDEFGNVKIHLPLTVYSSTGKLLGSETWTAPQEDLKANCVYWDGLVSSLGHGMNNASRFEFALYSITILMILTLVISKGNFGTAIIIGFLPYAYFLYLSLSTPCGEFIPTWTAVFVALIIGIKMKWF
jgi:hypothetical protein